MAEQSAAAEACHLVYPPEAEFQGGQTLRVQHSEQNRIMRVR